MILRKTRSIIDIGPDVITKTYRDPIRARAEIGWYQQVPWACPRLIDADPDKGKLVMAAHPVARRLPGYRPVEQLAELLYTLETAGVHHRDVHPGNVVAGPAGPLLIDWETATMADAPSYDLYGPDASGLPLPAIHAAVRSGYAMWWASSHPASIKNAWRADAIPARVA